MRGKDYKNLKNMNLIYELCWGDLGPEFKETKENCIILARVLDFPYSVHGFKNFGNYIKLINRVQEFRDFCSKNKTTRGFVFPYTPEKIWEIKLIKFLDGLFKTSRFTEKGFLWISGEDVKNPHKAFSYEDFETFNKAASKTKYSKDYLGERAWKQLNK